MYAYSLLCCRGVLLLLFVGCVVVTTHAQTTLTPEVYFAELVKYHPVIRRAALLDAQSAARRRIARGGFDPVLYGYYDAKEFKGKDYFSLFDAGVKIPTLVGAEVKAAYTTNSGYYLNPENTTPTGGLATVGVTMPLLQGLRFDDRRAALRQVAVFEQANAAEQRRLLNDLYFDAANAYWDWVAAAATVALYTNARTLAQKRYSDTRFTAEKGDKAAIDTVEARLYVLTAQTMLAEATARQAATVANLQNYRWAANNAAPAATVAAPSATYIAALPDAPTQLLDLELDSTQAAYNSLLNATAPDLLAYDAKLADLAIEQRLKAEKLLPKLNVTYNFLAQEWNYLNRADSPYGSAFQNYKWGVQLSAPIPMRAERGNLELTKLKIQDATLARETKEREIAGKLEGCFAELRANLTLARTYSTLVALARTMRDAEQEKLRLGESTLFLINSREAKLLESETKLAELTAKHFKYLAKAAWIAGNAAE